MQIRGRGRVAVYPRATAPFGGMLYVVGLKLNCFFNDSQFKYSLFLYYTTEIKRRPPITHSTSSKWKKKKITKLKGSTLNCLKQKLQNNGKKYTLKLKNTLLKKIIHTILLLYRKSAFQSIIDYCARGSFDVPFSTCKKISPVVKYNYVNNWAKAEYTVNHEGQRVLTILRVSCIL